MKFAFTVCNIFSFIMALKMVCVNFWYTKIFPFFYSLICILFFFGLVKLNIFLCLLLFPVVLPFSFTVTLSPILSHLIYSFLSSRSVNLVVVLFIVLILHSFFTAPIYILFQLFFLPLLTYYPLFMLDVKISYICTVKCLKCFFCYYCQPSLFIVFYLAELCTFTTLLLVVAILHFVVSYSKINLLNKVSFCSH